jgi:hypothetical protein
VHRLLSTATLLPDGQVLVAGTGFGTVDQVVMTELYTNGTWNYTGSLNQARVGSSAVLINSGQVFFSTFLFSLFNVSNKGFDNRRK